MKLMRWSYGGNRVSSALIERADRITVLGAFALFCIYSVLTSCGGGAGGSTPPVVAIKFPPFSAVRSDFIDPAEGLASNPMRVAFPPCVNLPADPSQMWLCSMQQAPQTVFPVTNAFSTAADPHFAWIISMNNEPIQLPGCFTGPPNQSSGPNDYPFAMEAASSLKLTVAHDSREFCGKLPYMSAAYLRGVQGDAMPRLLTWAELQGKTLDVDVDLLRTSNESAWFRVLTHYRDSAGQRYFVNKDFVMPDVLPDYKFPWNWPFIGSFQYPGAQIIIPARVSAASLPNGMHRISIPLTAQALQYFPSFDRVQPDFLGIEIAVEMGPVINSNSVTIRGVAIH